MRCRKQEGNTFIVGKPCKGDTEPGVVDQTIRTKEQPGNEHNLEPSTTIAGKLETAKTKLSPPDQVFVNLLDSPSSRRISKAFGIKNPAKISFQTAWFERFKWSHHDERRDAACCQTCLKALQSGMLTSSKAWRPCV